MKRYHLILTVLSPLILTILWIFPVSAQGLVIYKYPEVTCSDPGENGWCRGELSVHWDVPENALDVDGCEDVTISEDTNSLILTCTYRDEFYNNYGGGYEAKRDTTPPILVTNLPVDTPLTLYEGSSFLVDASSSNDGTSGIASIDWSLDGDWVFNDGNPALHQAIDGVSESDPPSQWLVARVVDKAGNFTQQAFEVKVYNIPPALNIPPGTDTHYGSYELMIPFSDPGILDTHTATVDWGDDTVEASLITEQNGAGFVIGSHSYKHIGAYTISLNLVDKDGSSTSASLDVKIQATEEIPFLIDASFSHHGDSVSYSSIFQNISPLVFSAQDSQASARLRLDPGGCLGQVSFDIPGSLTQDESLVTCMTDPGMSPDILNAYFSGEPDISTPELRIPLALVETRPDMTSTWSNPEPLTVGLFVQGCEQPDYHYFGDWEFETGQLTLFTSIDPTNQPQVILTGSPILTNLDTGTWDSIQNDCAGGDVLPAATKGLPLDFSGGNDPIAIDSGSLTGDMHLLQESIGSYIYDGILPLADGLRLNDVLVKAANAWADLRDDKAQHELDKFIGDVSRLVDLEQLPQDEGESLIGLTNFILDDLYEWQNPIPLDPLPSAFCGVGEICPETYDACLVSPDYITLYVDAHAAGTDPDGSTSAPFTTLVEALAHAEAMGACGVELSIGPGVYTGDLNITRHTRLSGYGRRFVHINGLITNFGPHVLEVFHVNILGSSSGALTGIYSNHPCAEVSVVDVGISDVYGYGIRQNGGTLLAWSVSVSRTKALSDHFTQGTGIYLGCGVQARLVEIDLNWNESTGLQVVGQGTNVRAYDLSVANTSMHPSYLETAERVYRVDGRLVTSYTPLDGTGGINVREGAVLTARKVSVQNNTSSGINITSGGSAFLESVHVSESQKYHGSNEYRRWTAGHGANTIATLGGHLEMVGFRNIYSEVCGNLLALDGEMDFLNGHIWFNPVGVCKLVYGYDLTRLAHGVIYRENGANIVSGAVIRIDPTLPDEIIERNR